MQIESIQQEFLKPEYIIKTIIQRRWLLIAPLMVALVVGSILAIKLPRVYEAETLILIEPQSVPSNYVQALSTDGIGDQISTLSQQILSRTSLEKIIKEFGLYSGPEFENMFLEDKVADLKKNIDINVTRRSRGTNAFSITYRGRNPVKVKNITNALASYFIDENLKVRESQAIGTSNFLESELTSMRRKLEEKEKALGAFRTSNMGQLPEQLETNLRILDRLQEQLTAQQENLRDAKSRLASLQTQAASGLLTGPAAGDAGPRQPDPLDPAALRAELARLQTRYTDKHPDIIKLKNQIKELEGKSGSSDSETSTAPIESAEVIDVQQEINNISNDISRIQSDIARYEQRVESTPKREQELLTLKRDYQNMQESYNSLLNRKLEAEIAVNMERKQKGEQFRVLDPARLPDRPVKPNMKMLIVMTVVAGIGIGGGIIFLLEFMNPGFRSPKEAELALGLPIIAMISIIADPKKRLLRRVNWIATGIALVATGMMFAVFAVLALKGIDGTLTIMTKVKDIII